MTPRDDEAPSWWAGTHGRLLLAGLLIAILMALVGTYFALDGARYLTLDAIRARQSELGTLYASHPLEVISIFFAVYVAVAALSLPGATLMTLVAGAIFGLLAGTILVSFASSIGAMLAFLGSRYLFRDAIERRFAARMAEIDRGIAKDGAFYLFMLRLVPIVPFFIVNLLMGLTRLHVGIFYVVTQIAMLAGTAVYVNAGTQLAKTQTLSDIVSPMLLASFALLGLFPWVAKRLVESRGRRQLHARWRRPRHFERNLVVIGAGAAGLVTSYVAAASGAAVTLVERGRMGGDCLNEGCVPSKALIRSAALLQQIRHARRYGVAHAEASVDFAEVMERIEHVVAAVAPHDSVERYRGLGVDVRQGHARIIDPWRVEIADADGRATTLTTRSIVIATGSEPVLPDLPGLEEAGCLTSETLWGLRELPRRLVVLGGGPIGCELAQCFARFGSVVVQIERGERLLANEDPDVSERVRAALVADGVQVLTGCEALRCERETMAGGWCLVVVADGVEQRIGFDRLLCAVGRRPRLAGYGLEELDVVTGGPDAPSLQTDAWLQTLYPNIYAAGDVVGPYRYTHVAAHQAWYAAVNALFGSVRRFKPDYRVIPRATFVDPEVAAVGLNEQAARRQGVAYELTTYDIAELDRAIVDSAAAGILKVLTVPGKDRILGVTIVAAHAAEMLPEFVLAMQQRIGLGRVLSTIHVYPTWSEANKAVAGEWRRRRLPERLLRWARRYHAWRRG